VCDVVSFRPHQSLGGGDSNGGTDASSGCPSVHVHQFWRAYWEGRGLALRLGGEGARAPTNPEGQRKKKRSKDASAEGERGEEVDGGGERRRRKRRARKKMKSKRGRERAAGPGQIHPNLLAKPSKRNINKQKTRGGGREERAREKYWQLG